MIDANGSHLPIRFTKDTVYSSGSRDLLLTIILHSPSISKNLLSFNKICRNNNVAVTFDESSMYLKDQWTNKLVVKGKTVDGLYQLDLG